MYPGNQDIHDKLNQIRNWSYKEYVFKDKNLPVDIGPEIDSQRCCDFHTDLVTHGQTELKL